MRKANFVMREENFYFNSKQGIGTFKKYFS
jgi:hypothetical protein